jgi:hypothetical protein
MPHFSSSHLLADSVAGDEKQIQKVLATVRCLEPSSLYPDKGVKRKRKKKERSNERNQRIKRFDFLHPYTIHQPSLLPFFMAGGICVSYVFNLVLYSNTSFLLFTMTTIFTNGHGE